MFSSKSLRKGLGKGLGFKNGFQIGVGGEVAPVTIVGGFERRPGGRVCDFRNSFSSSLSHFFYSSLKQSEARETRVSE